MKSRITTLAPLIIAMISFLVFASLVSASNQEQGIEPSGKSPSTLMIPVSHSHLLKTRVPIIRASVADPSVADVKLITPNQILVIAKAEKAADTTMILWQDENRIKTFDVHIYKTISPVLLNLLKSRLKKIEPSIEIEIMPTINKPENGTVLLTGEVSSQEMLDRALSVVESFKFKCFNLITITGSQQVQLKVVIAEISKSGLKQMGINFLSTNDNSRLGIFRGGSSEATTEFTNEKTIGSDMNKGSLVDDSSTNNKPGMTSEHTITTPFAWAFQIAMNSSRNHWIGMISLLKGQGLAKSLATPTLVAMNGQSAKFQVGGSYPIPVQNEKGGMTIEQVEYGIILNFTPYIIDHETITLEVAPEVSTPDYSLGVSAGGVTVPGLSTREGRTTLQLKDGQTFAMAGLLKEDSFVTTHKIPFLGDIPYLGTLFTSKETKHSETELVVMVTPKIVRPLNKDEIPLLPGQDTGNKISDIDFFIKNRLDLPVKNREAGNEFKGRSGFAK